MITEENETTAAPMVWQPKYWSDEIIIGLASIMVDYSTAQMSYKRKINASPSSATAAFSEI